MKEILLGVGGIIFAVAMICAGAYKIGYTDGYKEGYIMSLAKQEKGTPHDFILEEQDNGEIVWVENKEGKWE